MAMTSTSVECVILGPYIPAFALMLLTWGQTAFSLTTTGSASFEIPTLNASCMFSRLALYTFFQLIHPIRILHLEQLERTCRCSRLRCSDPSPLISHFACKLNKNVVFYINACVYAQERSWLHSGPSSYSEVGILIIYH